MHKRGEYKITLADGRESAVNEYSDCRDGVIEKIEYRDCSGYGSPTRLFFCQNTKHEHTSIVRQIKVTDGWIEEVMTFDSDSFEYLEQLLAGEGEIIRDYSK